MLGVFGFYREASAATANQQEVDIKVWQAGRGFSNNFITEQG